MGGRQGDDERDERDVPGAAEAGDGAPRADGEGVEARDGRGEPPAGGRPDSGDGRSAPGGDPDRPDSGDGWSAPGAGDGLGGGGWVAPSGAPHRRPEPDAVPSPPQQYQQHQSGHPHQHHQQYQQHAPAPFGTPPHHAAPHTASGGETAPPPAWWGPQASGPHPHPVPDGEPDPRVPAARDWWGAEDGSGPDADAAPLLRAERVRRLSPRSMVVGPINQLKGLLVPIVAGLVLGGFNAWVLGATGATVVALLVGGLITWRTTRYEVGEDRLEIRKGLIRRSQRTIPLERVRGVDVTSTLLHRVLGVAVVRIEAAAGSAASTEDGKLDAVAADEAERLRRVLLHRKAVLTGQETAAAAPGGEDAVAPGSPAEEGRAPSAAEDDTVTHFAMPRAWYLYGALSLGYLLTPFAVLATLFGTVQQTAGERATDFLVDWVTTSDRGFLLVFSLVFAGVLVLMMPVFAVVSYALTHWGFSLKGRDGSLVAERGLFTRRSVTLERRRIRGYELLDNPLERTRGAVRLRAIVTGLGDAANRAVLLPIGPRAVVEHVVDQALDLFRGDLLRHPRAALYRRLTRAVVPFVLAAAAFAALGLEWLAVAAAVLAVLGIPLAVDRYRSLGHGYDGERVSVRSGSLSRGQATVERSAVIGWTWTQTLFQRGPSLADLQVTVGAGAGGYKVQDASLTESVGFAARVTPEMVRPFLEPGADRGA